MATSAPTRFCTDYAKRVAKCQKCKMQLEKGVLRMGKIVPNFFVAAKDSSKPPPDMKQYFHKNCLFEMLFKARPTTKVIEETDEIEGFDELSVEDQTDIAKLVEELVEKRTKDGPAEPKTPRAPRAPKDAKEPEPTPSRKRANQEVKKSSRPESFDEESAYNSFHKFVQVCEVLKEITDTAEKSETISQIFKKKKFDGDVLLWLKFLMPSTDKRDYKVTDEQLVEHFSKILDTDVAKIQSYVSKSGDVALSIGHAHDKKVKNEKCGWSLQKVDRYLEKLSGLAEQDAVLSHLKFAAKKMRNDEVEMVVRLIRKQLDTKTDEKTVLKGVHLKAFAVFEKEGVEGVVESFYNKSFDGAAKNDEKKAEPKAKKSKKRHVDSDEESDVEMSDSESEGDDSDSDGGDSDELVGGGSDSEEVSEISSEEDDDDYKENKKAVPLPRGTRTRPRGDDGAIVKQTACPDGMEACRYGAECYRKSAEHKERFWHPAKN